MDTLQRHTTLERQAMRLARFSLVFVVMLVGSLLLRYGSRGIDRGHYALFVALLAFVGAFTLVKVKRQRVAEHAFAIGTAVLLLGPALFDGGLCASYYSTAVAVPVIGLAFLSPRGARTLLWAILVGTVLMYAAELTGMMPDAAPVPRTATATLQLAIVCIGAPLVFRVVQLARDDERRARVLVTNILSGIPDTIIRLDHDGTIIATHRATQNARVRPTQLHEVLPAQLSARVLEGVMSAREDGQVDSWLHRGEERTREVRLLRAHKEFTLILRDVTDRERVHRMKREFVSTVSHELRTPLTSIRGALGLARNAALPSAQKDEVLDLAEANAKRLGLLIDDLLDMEKIDNGRMQFNVERYALAPLLAEAVRLAGGLGDVYDVAFALESGAAADDAHARVDKHRFLQVVSNLLSNAAKFSPPGGHITVALTAQPSAWRVTVTDDGPGVPVGFVDQLFERFSQADSSDTRQKGGTGLGLAICRAITERHSGEIGYEKHPARGAAFWFTLPKAA